MIRALVVNDDDLFDSAETGEFVFEVAFAGEDGEAEDAEDGGRVDGTGGTVRVGRAVGTVAVAVAVVVVAAGGAARRRGAGTGVGAVAAGRAGGPFFGPALVRQLSGIKEKLKS